MGGVKEVAVYFSPSGNSNMYGGIYPLENLDDGSSTTRINPGNYITYTEANNVLTFKAVKPCRAIVLKGYATMTFNIKNYSANATFGTNNRGGGTYIVIIVL